MDAPAGDSEPRTPADAVAALYDRFGPALFRTACALLGRNDLAEDAVQEAFVGVVRARVVLTDLQNVRAYLFAAVRHAATKVRARAGREKSMAPVDLVDVVGPDPRPADLDRSERLDRALRDLPADQREVIALKIDGGLTFAEIAACLGVSPNTAASRYRYALEKLRADLKGAGDDS
jgi:RNA polymerase sigma-70 factor (ECF subfamily)